MHFGRTTLAIALAFSAMSAQAADMRTTRLSRDAEELADEMAGFVAISQACKSYNASSMNRSYWEPRINTTVPKGQLSLFAKIVAARAEPIRQQLSGPSSPLLCDDQLSALADRYPNLDEAGPAGFPVCFDDPIGDFDCNETHGYDPLAGVDALLEGY
jgi:hypothetical protein